MARIGYKFDDVLVDWAIRLVSGACIVSVFAVVGKAFRPTAFSGSFGAAPSIALAAALALDFARKGPEAVAVEARSMMVGAGAFTIYSIGSAWLETKEIPHWLRTGLLWSVCLASAPGISWILWR
jgi:hypothetical protein